jgi:2-oxoisovalerate dehydrogenase E1 component
MAKRNPLSPSKPWIELRTTPEDWAAADPQLLETLLGQGHIIRAFEEILLTLATEGLVHGPVHSSIGQEGGAIGSAYSLNTGDGVNGSHRGHHQFLAKVLNHVSGNRLDVNNLITPAIQEVVQRTMAEILGLAQGYCGGRGGSMHLQWLDAGALGTNAIVGGGAPLAAGNAFAQSRSGTNNVSVTYF